MEQSSPDESSNGPPLDHGSWKKRVKDRKIIFFGGVILILIALLFGVPLLLESGGTYVHTTLMGLLFLLLILAIYRTGNHYYQEIVFWKKIAGEKGWGYIRTRTPSTTATLLFSVGRFRGMHHILQGMYESFPVQTFEYKYTIGFGRFAESRSASVFKYKIDRFLPHCYLNHKDDRHVTTPPRTKKLPISEKFADTFDLYTTPEYEIEALALFNDEVMQRLHDMHWTHDVELVNNEIYIIHDNTLEVMFETKLKKGVDFEAKLKKGAEFARYILSLPTASGFTPIRETPYTFGDIRQDLPIWSIDRYGTDRSFQYVFYGLIVLVVLLVLLSHLFK